MHSGRWAKVQYSRKLYRGQAKASLSEGLGGEGYPRTTDPGVGREAAAAPTTGLLSMQPGRAADFAFRAEMTLLELLPRACWLLLPLLATLLSNRLQLDCPC